MLKGKKLLALVLSALLAFSVFSSLGFAAENQADKNQAAKKTVMDWLDQEDVSKKFAEVSDAIWSYAELGLEEYNSADLLQYVLEKDGFKVERGVADMPTAFVATFKNGEGPTVGILAEFDALPMLSQKNMDFTQNPIIDGAPGHGCTHNNMGTISIASAIAMKNAMIKHNITGTVKVFGSPAEETLISRPYMVRAGLFKDVDVVIDNHGGSNFGTGYGKGSTAMFSFYVTFKGKTAHSAGSPWNGRSALDAIEIMDVSVNFLREHLFYTERIHNVILDGGNAPNVVPDFARSWFFVRDSDENILDTYNRVIKCAQGAALATDTQLEVKVLTGIHQNYKNKALAEVIQQNIEMIGMPKWSESDNEFAKKLQKEMGKKEVGMPTAVSKLSPPSPIFTGGGSSDVGEVTLVVPTASVNFPTTVPGSEVHHWSYTATTGSNGISHKGLIAGAKAIATTGIDMLTKPEELAKIKAEFAEQQKQYPYKSYLPADAKPPVGFLKDQMEKYRPEMQKSYKNPSWYPGGWSYDLYKSYNQKNK